MTKEQLGYEAPTTTIFTVQVQRMLCGSPGAWDDSIVPGSNWGGDGSGYGLE